MAHHFHFHLVSIQLDSSVEYELLTISPFQQKPFSQKWSRSTRLQIVILMSCTNFLVEIVVGFLSRSLVLIADAFHVINDLLGYVVILYCMKLTQKETGSRHQTNSDQANLPFNNSSNNRNQIEDTEDDDDKSEKTQNQIPLTDRLSYGWRRAEIVSAFFNGSFLIALSVSIFLQALDRFVNPQEIDKPKMVVIVGAVSLSLNVLSAFIFHEHPDHEKNNDSEEAIMLAGHASHHHARLDRFTPKKQMNLAAMGVLIHILGDALNSIGVIIVGLISWFVKDSKKIYADPSFSIAIAISILLTSLPLAFKSAAILLQATPQNKPQEYILEDLMMLKDVEQVHDLHIWQIDQDKTVASAHVVIGNSTIDVSDPGLAANSKEEADAFVLNEVRNCFHAWGIHSVTLQLEHCPQQQEQQEHDPTTMMTIKVTSENQTNPSRNSLQENILRKRNHNLAYHAGLSCLADRATNCQCTLDYQLRCCSMS